MNDIYDILDDPKVQWQHIADNITDQCSNMIKKCQVSIDGYKETQHMFDALLQSGLGFHTLPLPRTSWDEGCIKLSFKTCCLLIGGDCYLVRCLKSRKFTQFDRFQVDELLAYLRVLLA